MNALLSEIRRSLVELDKGLKGQLNMSQSMEDLATAFGLNEWPGRNPFAQVCGMTEIAKYRWRPPDMFCFKRATQPACSH